MLHLLRYEDLVKNPKEILSEIFRFLNVSNDTSDFVNLSLLKHNRSKSLDSFIDKKTDFAHYKKTLAYMNEYYGTVRETSFEHDHWRKELPKEVLSEINLNEECAKTISLLQYNK